MELINTDFGLMRHSETQWNIEKKVQGHNNSPLSAKGIKMAESWGQILKDKGYARILSSDLGRAVQTAQIISRILTIPVTEEKGLREMDWGKWTGKKYTEVKKGTPNIIDYNKMSGWDFRPPAGETRKSVYKRACAALSRAAQIWPDEKILVVTHEGVIHCIINFFLDRKFVFSEPLILKPSHVHCLVYNQNGFSIAKLNAVDLAQKLSNNKIKTEVV